MHASYRARRKIATSRRPVSRRGETTNPRSTLAPLAVRYPFMLRMGTYVITIYAGSLGHTHWALFIDQSDGLRRADEQGRYKATHGFFVL